MAIYKKIEIVIGKGESPNTMSAINSLNQTFSTENMSTTIKTYSQMVYVHDLDYREVNEANLDPKHNYRRFYFVPRDVSPNPDPESSILVRVIN